MWWWARVGNTTQQVTSLLMTIYSNLSELLTDFQRDKFTYFFYHVLDLNSDHVISAEDFVKLNARVMHYMDWSVNTIQFMALQVTIRLNDKLI